MKKQTVRLLALVFIPFIIILSACRTRSVSQPIPTPIDNYFPSSEWRVSSPEEQGVDPNMLDDMLEEIDRMYWDVDNITIIRYGYKIFDVSLNDYQPDEIHRQ